MANIRVDVDGVIIDGQSITFKAPCNCSEIEKLKIYYIKNGVQVSELFTMKDSLGKNLSNVDNLFSKDAYVKAILDTVNKRAYLQNAATSGYLEEKVAPVDNFESERTDLSASARTVKVLNDKFGGVEFGIDGEGNRCYLGADGSLIPFSGPVLIRYLSVTANWSTEGYNNSNYASGSGRCQVDVDRKRRVTIGSVSGSVSMKIYNKSGSLLQNASISAGSPIALPTGANYIEFNLSTGNASSSSSSKSASLSNILIE